MNILVQHQNFAQRIDDEGPDEKNKGVNYLIRSRHKFALFSSKQITIKEGTLWVITYWRDFSFVILIKIMCLDCIICNQLTFIFKCTRINFFSCKILRSNPCTLFAYNTLDLFQRFCPVNIRVTYEFYIVCHFKINRQSKANVWYIRYLCWQMYHDCCSK